MKNKLVVMMIASALVSGLAFAADAPAPPADASHPCRVIEQACETAHFVRHGHTKDSKKGLFVDCLRPILNGQTVEGVPAQDAKVIEGCKARMAKHHHKENDAK